MDANRMIPIALVTGFLGSGKTSFLKDTVRRYRHRRLVYLVNEFSPLDVDGALVADEGADVVAIPGGSIFCKCLVTEFINQLWKIARDYPGIEGVVIEASGMANPAVIGVMLKETKLDAVYALATVVAIVDPGSFLKLQHTLPNVLDQVRAAQVVLMNKTDCHDAATLDTTEARVRELNPAAILLRTMRGHADIDPFALPTAAPERGGEYAACRDPRFRSDVLAATVDVDLARLAEILHALGDDCYRAKGYLPSNGALHFVDLSSSGLTITPTTRPGATGELAVVLRGSAPDDATLPLRNLLRCQS
jgi:G3E family GTPase